MRGRCSLCYNADDPTSDGLQLTARLRGRAVCASEIKGDQRDGSKERKDKDTGKGA
jgi:hypothetical protein